MTPDDAPEESPEGFLDGARTLTVNTVKDALDDRVPALAGGVAFFTILALPPLILGFFGVAGFISDLIGTSGTETIREWVLDVAENVLSDSTIEDAVIPTLDAVLEEGRADIAIIGLTLALWSGSRATTAAMEAVTVAYDREPRKSWQRRLLALGLTVVGVLVGLTLVPVLVLGPELPTVFGIDGGIFDTIWQVAYWPGVGLLVMALIATFFHVAVPWSTPWRRDFPGAILAVVLWLAGAAGLRLYTAWSIQGDSTYGPLATPIVILLWLYVTALAVLMGAELNAEIEKLWPHRSVRHQQQAAAEAPPEKDPEEIDDEQEAVQG